MRSIISAEFSPMERQSRLALLGNPEVEELGTKPTLYVLRFRGQKIGVGFTLDVAIADAESNIQSYIHRQNVKKQKVMSVRKAG